MQAVVRDCERASDLPGLIRAASGNVKSVIIGGGDGTLNAALPGLLETGLPLGIHNPWAWPMILPAHLGSRPISPQRRALASPKVEAAARGYRGGSMGIRFSTSPASGSEWISHVPLRVNSKRRFGSPRMRDCRPAGIVTAEAVSAPRSSTAPPSMSHAPFTLRSATAGTMAVV